MCPYQIEKNVPLHPDRLPPIPFKELEVGYGVKVTLKKASDLGVVRQRVWRENDKNKNLGKKERYSCHQLEDGLVRVSRTA